MIPLFFTLSYFNSHAHVERDQAGNVRRNAVLHFNSHAHVERDVVLYGKSNTGKTDFNSHAHVERDTYYLLKINYFVISTHTLTWSVTSSEVIQGLS